MAKLLLHDFKALDGMIYTINLSYLVNLAVHPTLDLIHLNFLNGAQIRVTKEVGNAIRTAWEAEAHLQFGQPEGQA